MQPSDPDRPPRRERRARPLAVWALMVLLGQGCGGDAAEPDVPQVEIDEVLFSLLQRSDLWTATTESGGEVRTGSLLPRSLPGAGDLGVLPALVMSPPAVVNIQLPVLPTGARLRFATGLGDAEYRAGQAAVRFEVAVDGELVHAESRQPTERTQVPGREWTRAEVPVGSRSSVTLRTRAIGAGDTPREVGFGLLEVVHSEEVERTRASVDEPNLIFICIDTLRADRLSCYGHSAPTTPNLDRLARGGMLFEHAYSVSPWTWPSTASLLTGLSPPEHGLLDRDSCFLSHELVTLPESLQRAGLTTGAFSTNGLISASKGFAQGFEHFSEHDWLDTDRILPGVFDWLERVHEWRFFLYLHLTEPHSPYAPPEHFAERFAADAPPGYEVDAVRELHEVQLREPTGDAARLEAFVSHESRLYDAEIAAVDHRLGRLFARLEELGLAGRTVIAVTSDHGEEFLDHGLRGHGKQLYDESVRVPLIVHGPGIPVARVQPPVENRWLAPTLARLMGAESFSEDGFEESADLLDAAKLAARRGPIFFTTQRSQWADVQNARLLRFPAMHAVQVAGRRLIWAPESEGSPGLELLYDVPRDPLMLQNLLLETPLTTRESLKHRVGSWLEHGRSVRPEALDGGDSALEMLRELGYVE